MILRAPECARLSWLHSWKSNRGGTIGYSFQAHKRKETSRARLCYSAGTMTGEQRKKTGTRDSLAARMALLSSIITILPASMLAGWLLGYFLIDRFLEIFPWGSIVCALFGAGAGFYQIIRILGPGKGKSASRGQSWKAASAAGAGAHHRRDNPDVDLFRHTRGPVFSRRGTPCSGRSGLVARLFGRGFFTGSQTRETAGFSRIFFAPFVDSPMPLCYDPLSFFEPTRCSGRLCDIPLQRFR